MSLHLPFGPMRPTLPCFPSSPGSPFSPSSPFEMENESGAAQIITQHILPRIWWWTWWTWLESIPQPNACFITLMWLCVYRLSWTGHSGKERTLPVSFVVHFSPHCWGRSLSWCDCPLTCELDLGNRLKALHPIPSLETYKLSTIPIVGAISMMQPWESEVFLRHLAGVRDRILISSIWTFETLAGKCVDLVLPPLKTSLICNFPCLLTLPPTNLDWSASSLVSPCPQCMRWGMGGSFKFSARNSQFSNLLTLCLKTYLCWRFPEKFTWFGKSSSFF